MADTYVQEFDILIHTSVKLVTKYGQAGAIERTDFNPHEREARDRRHSGRPPRPSLYFNPHEREARDAETAKTGAEGAKILIHTSVKLVTRARSKRTTGSAILIHTSVKLVTLSPNLDFAHKHQF